MNNLKKISCPICGSKKFITFQAMKKYFLYQCKECGMVWDPYPPKHLNRQYNKNYFINQNSKGGYANYFEGIAINKKTFIERLKMINKKMGYKGKLLDIGCAFGDCLVMAKNMGWKNPEGLELSRYAYNFAKEKGIKVKNGNLEKINYPQNNFDIVTIQDVIEHVKNPLEDLRKIHKILKPKGWVFIVTPNIEGKWSKLLGSFWYHYKPGEHVLYFSPKSINNALKKTGFVNIKIKGTYHIMSLGYILNRLRYYFPVFSLFLLNLIKKTPFHDLTLKLYTGELEAWAQKL